MKEYKIIEGAAIDCQKWLNQWRHQYDIEVLQMCRDGAGFVTILLTREEKK